MPNSLKISLSLAILVISIGCSAKNSERPEDSVSSVKDDKSSMKDISIQHCLDDGYEAVSVMKGGVPARYLCVNPKTKQKCETWAYYRGSCKLADSNKQSSPSSGISIKSK
jgi:putative hemolysin